MNVRRYIDYESYEICGQFQEVKEEVSCLGVPFNTVSIKVQNDLQSGGEAILIVYGYPELLNKVYQFEKEDFIYILFKKAFDFEGRMYANFKNNCCFPYDKYRSIRKVMFSKHGKDYVLCDFI